MEQPLVLSGQVECFEQCVQGCSGRVGIACLQVLETTHTQRCSVGQGFLGQPCRAPVVSQQEAKRQRTSHVAIVPSLGLRATDPPTIRKAH